MKSRFLLLLLVFMTLAGNTLAENYYVIHILGICVTDTNKDDVLGDGTVSFDPTTNTLTLHDADLNYPDVYQNPQPSAIYINRPNVWTTIRLEGENSISAPNRWGIQTYSNLIIEGDGELYIYAKNCIYVSDSKLYIQDGCELNLEAHAISPYYPNQNCKGCLIGTGNSRLSVADSKVTCVALAFEGTTISGFLNVDISEPLAFLPYHGTYEHEDVTITYNNSGIEKYIQIEGYDEHGQHWGPRRYDGGLLIDEPMGTKYGISVANVQVTSLNKNDILEDGTVSYDDVSNTLVLDNASIATADHTGIALSHRGTGVTSLNIQLVGVNHINAKNGIFGGDNRDFVIKGTGTLDITSRENGIEARNLTIEEASVFIASGSFYVPIQCKEMPTLNGVLITSPQGGYFYRSNSNYYVYLDGVEYHGSVAINMKEYDLWVAGTRVTSMNCDDVLDDGTVIYDDESHTLRLANANIDGGNAIGIRNKIPDLTVAFSGTNTITSLNKGIYSEACDLTIARAEEAYNASLSITGNDGISVYHGNLAFRNDCVVNVTGTGVGNYAGIFGSAGYELSMEGTQSVVTVNSAATGRSAICGFGSIRDTDYWMDKPAGGSFSNQYVLDSDGHTYYGEVVLRAIVFDIKVAGVMVTIANYNDVLGDHTVSYDRASNTLILNGADIHATGASNPGIESHNDNLTIELRGSNTVYGFVGGIVADKDLTISGEGSLNVSGENGIKMVKSNLTFNNDCTVVAESTSYGDEAAIYCTSSLQTNITIDRCSSITARAQSTYFSAIHGFGDLNLIGAAFTTPADGHYFVGDIYVDLDNSGTLYTDEVVIEGALYPLWIAGTQVHGTNMGHVTGSGISGLVSYDDATHTLTLENANIQAGFSNPGIESHIDNLTIELRGSNTVYGRPGGIVSDKNLTIGGMGALNVSGEYGIRMNGKDSNFNFTENLTLTLNNGCTVVAESIEEEYPAIYCSSGLYTNITIDRCTSVTARAQITLDSAISGFDYMNLVDATFITPADGEYILGDIWVDDVSTRYTGEVVIEAIKYDLWVAGNRVTMVNANDILGNGTAVYDAESNTLTLSAATIEGGSSEGIRNEIDSLNIMVTGINQVSSDISALFSNKDFEITGDGILVVTGSNGIDASQCDLAIHDGVCVYATGTGTMLNAGVIGNYGYTLTVSNSKLTANTAATTRSAVSGFSTLSFNSVEFVTPEEASYRNNNVYSSGHLYLDQVVIEPIKYDLWVNGVQVTTANASHVTGLGIMGDVSYDPINNILTLSDTELICSADDAGIDNHIYNLTIMLEGANSITASGPGIHSDKKFTIDGGGTLDVTGLDGIFAENAVLFMQGGCTIHATATGPDDYAGIRGTASGYLRIDGCDVTANNVNTALSPIYGFSTMALIGCSITDPDDAVWNDDHHRVEDAEGEAVTSQVTITLETFDLWVGGVQVTQGNAHDVLGNGRVSYDRTTQTLTLNHASISTTGTTNGIENRIRNLKINLVSYNSITSSEYGIVSMGDFTIQGQGTLNVTGLTGIYASDCNLTIEGGCTVNATGTSTNFSGGIKAYESMHHGLTLTIESSIVNADSPSTDLSAINGFSNLNLIGSQFDTPEGGTYHDNGVYDGEDAFYGQVKIGLVKYPLLVAGIQVTAANAEHITGTGITGDVHYDAVNKILTLSDATIATTNKVGIQSNIEGLTLMLEGTNNITAESKQGIFSSKTMTIDGTGSLTVTGISGILAQYSDLTIQGGCQVNAIATSTANVAGIYGYPNYSLTIDRSSVSASTASTAKSAICGFTTLNMNLVGFTTPSNVVYSNGGVYRNSTLYFGQVVIESVQYDLYVMGNRVTMLNADDVLGDGKVSYDAENNILSLNGANIESEDAVGIWNGIPGLTLLVSGVNHITSHASGELAAGIYSDEDLTIEGLGNLEVTGTRGIYAFESDLTIQGGCRVNASGAPGIFCNDFDHDFTISQSYVTATTQSDDYTAIAGFDNLTFDNVMFVTPSSDCQFNDGVLWYDGPYYGPVEIAPYYQLYVAGTRVTYMNAGDVLGDGTVRFDASTNTLTLNGAVIDDEDGAGGIESSIPDLRIVLKNTNTITSTDMGIYAHESFSFDGNGILDVTGRSAIYTFGDLTIQGGCTIHATGTMTGNSSAIYAISGCSLQIIYSTLVANTASTMRSAIYGFDNMSVAYSLWAQPTNGTYHDQNVYAAGDIYYGEVFIAAKYDLRIADVWVNAYNAADVLGDGTVSYNYMTNTLTLDGANIVGDAYQGILNEMEGLVIEERGINYITSNSSGIYSDKDFTITGRGNLYVTGDDGIYADQCDLTLQGGCSIIASSTSPYDYYSGIYGAEGYALTIDSCMVLTYRTHPSANRSALYGFSTLNLNKVEFLSPEDGTYHDRSVYSQGAVYTDDVEIIPFFDLWVAGVRVNIYNASDVLYDGTVSYDPTINTLTLYEANISSDDNYGIENKIEGLVIAVEGDNYIASNHTGITSSKTFTIEGDGSLSITIDSDYGDGIYAYAGDVTIQDGCTLTTNGIIHGASDLTISRSYVTANSSSDVMSSIYGFKHLNLDRAQITIPSSGTYHDYFVYDGNQRYYGNVVISPKSYELWVGGVNVNASNCHDVLEDGSVSYDETENTLTLNGMGISVEGGDYGVDSYIEGLKIRLIGENYIGGGDYGIYTEGKLTTFTGTGSLYIDGSMAGIYGADDHAYITFRDGCHVMSEGLNYGAVVGPLGYVIIDNAYVTLGGDVQALYCGTLTLQSTEITSPSNAYAEFYYDDSEGQYVESVFDEDGDIATWVVFAPCNIFNGRDNADWGEAENWSKNVVPTVDSKVYINTHCEIEDLANANEISFLGDADVEVKPGQVLRADKINTTAPEQLVIDDGGQLYCNSNNVQATFHKTILNATANTNGWYGIASPISFPTIENLASNTYDLYEYCEGCDQEEWRNYNGADLSYAFAAGQGFLYANCGAEGQESTDLVMKGTLTASSWSAYIPVYCNAGFEGIKGYNLIGNPYPHNISMSDITINDEPITEFYRIAGDHIERCTSGEILPGEAFFVKVDRENLMIIIAGE